MAKTSSSQIVVTINGASVDVAGIVSLPSAKAYAAGVKAGSPSAVVEIKKITVIETL